MLTLRRIQGCPRLSPAPPSPASIFLLLNQPRPPPGFHPGPHFSSPQPPLDFRSAQTAALFGSVYNEPSALCSPALPQSPPVSGPGYQATTFKYLLSRLQQARASGQLHWKSKQSKRHSHSILIILQSLQMTLTSYVTEHLTSYVPPSECLF